MMAEFRSEVTGFIEPLCCVRRPSIRRCDDPEWLLATDLPLLIDQERMKEFLNRISEAGWQSQLFGDWLYLRREIKPPEYETRADEQICESCMCLISLLERHPGGESSQRERIAMCKAEEYSRQEFLRFMDLLHREWATRLRQRVHLPSDLAPWLLMIENKRR